MRYYSFVGAVLGMSMAVAGVEAGAGAQTATSAPAPSATTTSNAERVLGGYYVRQHPYDLIHQDIVLKNFDWPTISFDGEVTSTVVVQVAGTDSLRFDAGSLLSISGVTSATADARKNIHVAALTYTHEGDALVVHLPKPAAKGDTVRFTVTYRARIDTTNSSMGTGLHFVQETNLPRHRQQLWSQGEEENNHRWFPTYDAPNDKATWDMTVTAPSQFMVISNGKLISDKPAQNGQHTVHWRQLRPSSTYLASLILSPLVTVRDSVKSGDRYVQLEYNVYAPDTGLARRAFESTPKAITVYERLTGVRYPWTRYAQTEVAEFPYGGMENVGATTLYDPIPDARAFLDDPYFSEQVVPHELAHQWFGDYVTTVDWVNEWLNEGFATFMNGQYLGAVNGHRAEQEFFLSQYLQYRQSDSKRRIAVTGLAQDILYNKGSSILEMLKLYLGDAKFWAVIHEYLTEHAHGNVVSSDLSHAVQKVTGQNVDWFFDEWVYKAGHPEFSVSATYDSTARRLTLQVSQTQTPRTDTVIDTYDEKIAPSQKFVDTTLYETPAVFRMPVSILIGTANGDITRRVDLNARMQTVTIDSLPGTPTLVSFDYIDGIVKSLRFDQPTSWLTALLAREVSPFQVLWTVEQLQARAASDSAALAALTSAVTGAHYALTRAQVAGALGHVQGQPVVDALQAAMRDTSALVRRSALAALAAHGGPVALSVARDAFKSDSSYKVQATAIYAIARLDTDSAERHTLLSQALGMPSYQDVIQTTALQAIAQMGDMSFIPELEHLLDQQGGVAQVLAAFAQRGSTEARDILTRHLNDSRPLVKRWVAEAYKQ